MFVKCANKDNRASDYLTKVRYGLHETFGCEYLDCNAGKNFEMGMIGWGTFDIPVTFFFKRQARVKNLEINHMLSFEGNGKWRKIEVPFSKKALKNLLPNGAKIPK
mmetsp:Transcript_64351/g.89031  ORF Transcript_64351/g.89031 Transcript_64351/m.89031 type:complete len:106 (+) Transcript_64351:465-782(+)